VYVGLWMIVVELLELVCLVVLVVMYVWVGPVRLVGLLDIMSGHVKRLDQYLLLIVKVRVQVMME